MASNEEELSPVARILLRATLGPSSDLVDLVNGIEARWRAVQSLEVFIGLNNRTMVPEHIFGTRLPTMDPFFEERSTLEPMASFPYDRKRAFLVLGLVSHFHVIDTESSVTLVALTCGVLIRHCSDSVCFGILDHVLEKRLGSSGGGGGGEGGTRRERTFGPLHNNGVSDECSIHETFEELLFQLLPKTALALAVSEGVRGADEKRSSNVEDAGVECRQDCSSLAMYSTAVCSGLLLNVLPSEGLRVMMAAEFLRHGWRAVFLYGIGLIKTLKRGIKRRGAGKGLLRQSNDGTSGSTVGGASGLYEGAGKSKSVLTCSTSSGRSSSPHSASIQCAEEVVIRLKKLVVDALDSSTFQSRGSGGAQSGGELQGLRPRDVSFFEILEHASCHSTRGRKGKWEGVPSLGKLKDRISLRALRVRALLTEGGTAENKERAQLVARICSWEFAVFAHLPPVSLTSTSASNLEVASAGAMHPVMFSDATNALLREVEAQEKLTQDVSSGASSKKNDVISSMPTSSTVFPSLLLSNTDDRCALLSWLPFRLQQRRIDLIFSTDRDGYHLPTLLRACHTGGIHGRPAVATLLVIAASTGGLFGFALFDASWSEVEHGKSANGGVFEGGNESFLFTLPSPQRSTRSKNGDSNSSPKTKNAGASYNSLGSDSLNLLEQQRRCYVYDPVLTSTSTALNVTANFLGVGPAENGDGYALLLCSDLHRGSSVATRAFKNPPLHGAVPAGSAEATTSLHVDHQSDLRRGVTPESDQRHRSPFQEASDFDVSTVELYSIV